MVFLTHNFLLVLRRGLEEQTVIITERSRVGERGVTELKKKKHSDV
jgi:hypothetical protein